MKKFKIIAYSFIVAITCWLALSWIDVVSDNCKPNPTHSPYNAFVLTSKAEEAPIPVASSEVSYATILKISDKIITFETMDGNLWEVEVDDLSEYDVSRYYGLVFAGSDIIKIFKEVW